jgi:hypothetical protein
VIQIGKLVVETTNYKLLPSRIVYPENYVNSPSSLASKKELLISLGPMLTDGEEQRNKDVTTCEDYTRCKIEKVKTKSSTYEYFDMDIQSIIPPVEYEKR